MRSLIIGAAIVVAGLGAGISGQPAAPLLGGRSLVHAHNCYPEEGQWSDRIDRALAIRQVPTVIEQDIAFAPRNAPRDQSVVAHDAKLAAAAPSLRHYFFNRVGPVLDRALASGQQQEWPVVVLHLDFKSNEREHHRAVWDLLKQHQAWLTTAAVSADPARVNEVKRGPLLVLTENGEGQERDFTEWAAAEGSLLLFGSIPAPVLRASDDAAERARILRAAAPGDLVPTAATNYRRWVNFSWGAIEEGGPSRAGGWTPDDQQRLDAVVSYAHRQGLFVRFYTLNGHSEAMNRGWTASYNFGALEAARVRWRAARRSGVELIASDQYEELAAVLNAARP